MKNTIDTAALRTIDSLEKQVARLKHELANAQTAAINYEALYRAKVIECESSRRAKNIVIENGTKGIK